MHLRTKIGILRIFFFQRGPTFAVLSAKNNFIFQSVIHIWYDYKNFGQLTGHAEYPHINGNTNAAIIAEMGEVRATKGRELGAPVCDSSARSKVRTLEEKYMLVATKMDKCKQRIWGNSENKPEITCTTTGKSRQNLFINLIHWKKNCVGPENEFELDYLNSSLKLCFKSTYIYSYIFRRLGKIREEEKEEAGDLLSDPYFATQNIYKLVSPDSRFFFHILPFLGQFNEFGSILLWES